jgi:hypothetical protein
MARFTLPARLKCVYWAPANPTQPTNMAAPSQVQIAAASNLIGSAQGEGLAMIDGFKLEPSTFPVPDYTSNLVGTVPGDTTVPDSALTFWMDDTTRVLYDLFVIGAAGIIGFFFDGTTASKESKLSTVRVISKEREYDRDKGHQFVVAFAPAVPVIGVAAA